MLYGRDYKMKHAKLIGLSQGNKILRKIIEWVAWTTDFPYGISGENKKCN